MKKCPQCGAENPDDAEYCSLCLTSFEDTTGLPGDVPTLGEPLSGPEISTNAPGAGVGGSPGFPPAETQTPGTAIPPPPGAISTFGPASDFHAMGERGLPQGTFPAPQDASRKRSPVGFIIAIIIGLLMIGGGIAAAIILTSGGGSEGGKKVFSLSGSKLTFEYPGSWVEFSEKELSGMPGWNSYDIATMEETILADDDELPTVVVLIACSKEFEPVSESEYLNLFDNIMSNITGLDASSLDANVDYTSRKIDIGGHTWLEATFTDPSQTDRQAKFLLTVYRGYEYVILYSTAGPYSEHEAQYNELLGSISFTD